MKVLVGLEGTGIFDRTGRAEGAADDFLDVFFFTSIFPCRA